MQLYFRFLKCCLLLHCMLSASSTTAQADNQQWLPETGVTASTKRIYNEAARSWYGVYYSSDTLYICITVTDQLQQRKLVMNGLEVWIDPKGKRNKKTGILYPFRAVSHQEERLPEGKTPSLAGGDTLQGISDQLPSLEKQLAQQHEMRLTGLKEELNGVQNNFHPSGIRMSFSFVKDTLLCQAQLPINTLIEHPDLYSRWSVGLIEKGSPMTFFGGDPLPPAGTGDGMMPPPGPLPPGEDGMRIFEDNAIWFRLPLLTAGVAEKGVAGGTAGKNK